MCGIVGLISKQGLKDVQKRRKVLTQLLCVDTLRGTHSTGMFMVHKDARTVDTMKRAMQGWEFTDLKTYEKLVYDLDNYPFVVGHNRHATIGKVNAENAHPFDYGHITGVHNGSITNKYDLEKGTSFDVDSQAIFYNISKKGIEDTVAKMRGAFALVWWDAVNKSLHMIRNNERPLVLGFVEDTKEIYFASEEGALEWITSRNGIHLDATHMLQVGTEYIFGIDDPWDFKTRKLELYKPKATVYTGKSKTDWSKNKEEKDQKRAKLIEQAGYKPRERIPFYLCEWKRYSTKSPIGYGEAVLAEEPFSTVIIHQMSYNQYQNWKDCPVTGAITNVVKGKDDDEFVLHVNVASINTYEVEEVVENNQGGGKVIALPDKSKTVAGPKGEISLEEYDKLTKHGCLNCGTNISYDDAPYVSWNGTGGVYCPDCTTEFVEGYGNLYNPLAETH